MLLYNVLAFCVEKQGLLTYTICSKFSRTERAQMYNDGIQREDLIRAN